MWGVVVHGVWGRPCSRTFHPSSRVLGSLIQACRGLCLSLTLVACESRVCCCSLAALRKSSTYTQPFREGSGRQVVS